MQFFFLRLSTRNDGAIFVFPYILVVHAVYDFAFILQKYLHVVTSDSKRGFPQRNPDERFSRIGLVNEITTVSSVGMLSVPRIPLVFSQ